MKRQKERCIDHVLDGRLCRSLMDPLTHHKFSPNVDLHKRPTRRYQVSRLHHLHAHSDFQKRQM